MGYKKRTRQHDLADLASRQHGVVSTRQLEALGFSRKVAAQAAAAGRMHRLHRGVYAVGHSSLSWHGRCLAAVLACAPDAVASHASAAWLWGLLRSRPSSFDVSASTRRHPKRLARVHYGRLRADDVSELEAIPVTALPRTLLDFASVASLRRLEQAIERSDELGLFDLGPTEELLGRTVGHPGSGKLRRAIELYRPEAAFTRSGLERRFLELIRGSDLPLPSMNFNEGGFELDAYWQTERFAVELDVYETHGTRAAFERDRLRQEDLMLVDIQMTRVTGPRLKREPKAVVERVRTLLQQRRRQLAQTVRRTD